MYFLFQVIAAGVMGVRTGGNNRFVLVSNYHYEPPFL